jgi:hypothetical protein
MMTSNACDARRLQAEQRKRSKYRCRCTRPDKAIQVSLQVSLHAQVGTLTSDRIDADRFDEVFDMLNNPVKKEPKDELLVTHCVFWHALLDSIDEESPAMQAFCGRAEKHTTNRAGISIKPGKFCTVRRWD